MENPSYPNALVGVRRSAYRAVPTQLARERIGGVLARTGTVPVVDETSVELGLDGTAADRPAPFAASSRETHTIGSAGKTWWGGLRVVTCPPASSLARAARLDA